MTKSLEERIADIEILSKITNVKTCEYGRIRAFDEGELSGLNCAAKKAMSIINDLQAENEKLKRINQELEEICGEHFDLLGSIATQREKI